MAIGLSKKTIDLDGSTVIARTGVAVQTGTQTEHDAYTGELGEITYNTTDGRLHIHDGTTAGGIPMSRESENTAAEASATPVGGHNAYGTGLATVATLGVPVKLVSTTTPQNDANGFTVGTDNTITATYVGTKLCNIKGRFDVDIATGTDNVTLHVFVGGASAYETPAQSVASGTPKLFEIDVLLDVANGEAIEIYAENEDTAENVDTAAAVPRQDTAAAHGFLRVTA